MKLKEYVKLSLAQRSLVDRISAAENRGETYMIESGTIECRSMWALSDKCLVDIERVGNFYKVEL